MPSKQEVSLAVMSFRHLTGKIEKDYILCVPFTALCSLCLKNLLFCGFEFSFMHDNKNPDLKEGSGRMNKTMECPKCEGKMNRGRLYTPKSATSDATHIFDYVNWEAANEKKFGGLFAYKCDTCGFIEFYVENPARKV